MIGIPSTTIIPLSPNDSFHFAGESCKLKGFDATEDLVYGGELSAEAVQRLFLPNQQKVWMVITSGQQCNHGDTYIYIYVYIYI